MGMSKKNREVILQKRFPNFFKLSQELSLSLDVVIMELEEKLEQIERVKDLQEELEQAKDEIDL